MKANELRIGNYYKDKHCIGSIVGYDLFMFEGYCLGVRHIKNSFCESWEPIPLTEQWLKDFKFRYYKSHFNSWELNGVSVYWPEHKKNEKHFTVWVGRNREDGQWVKLELKLYHVHQLQNLYFALTGKELTK